MGDGERSSGVGWLVGAGFLALAGTVSCASVQDMGDLGAGILGVAMLVLALVCGFVGVVLVLVNALSREGPKGP